MVFQKSEYLPESEILSPVQMFILQRCLPTTVYFPKQNSSVDKSTNSSYWSPQAFFSPKKKPVANGFVYIQALSKESASIGAFRSIFDGHVE